MYIYVTLMNIACVMLVMIFGKWFSLTPNEEEREVVLGAMSIVIVAWIFLNVLYVLASVFAYVL